MSGNNEKLITNYLRGCDPSWWPWIPRDIIKQGDDLICLCVSALAAMVTKSAYDSQQSQPIARFSAMDLWNLIGSPDGKSSLDFISICLGCWGVVLDENPSETSAAETSVAAAASPPPNSSKRKRRSVSPPPPPPCANTFPPRKPVLAEPIRRPPHNPTKDRPNPILYLGDYDYASYREAKRMLAVLELCAGVGLIDYSPKFDLWVNKGTGDVYRAAKGAKVSNLFAPGHAMLVFAHNRKEKYVVAQNTHGDDHGYQGYIKVHVDQLLGMWFPLLVSERPTKKIGMWLKSFLEFLEGKLKEMDALGSFTPPQKGEYEWLKGWKLWVEFRQKDGNFPGVKEARSKALWIQRVPAGTTEEEMRLFFGPFGDISEITLLEGGKALVEYNALNCAVEAYERLHYAPQAFKGTHMEIQYSRSKMKKME